MTKGKKASTIDKQQESVVYVRISTAPELIGLWLESLENGNSKLFLVLHVFTGTVLVGTGSLLYGLYCVQHVQAHKRIFLRTVGFFFFNFKLFLTQ